MSDIFEIMKKIEDSAILELHPIVQMDLELKMHYLNGLALMMNVDGEIHEKEKEYLSALINISGMNDNTLKSMLEFCTDPNPELVKEMIQELKKDAKIAKLFLLDLFILAEKDGHFHEKEKQFISKISDVFSVPIETITVMEHLATALKTKDKVFLLTLYIDDFPLYEEVSSFIEAFNMDIKDELEKLFDFQFEKWEFEKNEIPFELKSGIKDDNPVSTKPVSNSQFCEFLNYAFCKKIIKMENENSKFTQGEKLIIDLDHSDIRFDEGIFTSASKSKEQPVTGITCHGARSFIKWVNENLLKNKPYNIELLTFLGGLFRQTEIRLKSPRSSSLNEICLHDSVFNIKKLPSSFFSGDRIYFQSIDSCRILETYLNKDLTFRVMKKNKGELND